MHAKNHMPYSHQLQNTARVVCMPQHSSLIHAPGLHRSIDTTHTIDVQTCMHVLTHT